MLPSPSTSPARAALIDHTNVKHEPSPSPTRMSRKRSGLPTPTSARQVKRARVYSTGKGAEPAFARLRLFDDIQDFDPDSSSDEEGTAGQGPSTRPARTVFSMRAAAARGQRPTMNTTYRKHQPRARYTLILKDLDSSYFIYTFILCVLPQIRRLQVLLRR
jgi:hypothetical protein